jgi:hypothetical protein
MVTRAAIGRSRNHVGHPTTTASLLRRGPGISTPTDAKCGDLRRPRGATANERGECYRLRGSRTSNRPARGRPVVGVPRCCAVPAELVSGG